MARVRRIDVAALAKPERTTEGWLRAEAHTARVGILEYDQPDGTVRRELVTPEVLFEAASIATARLVPLTLGHPEQLLTSETARQHAIGAVGDSRPDGDYLATPIMVWDKDAVAAIERGQQEMSWGYDCDLDEVPGVHPTFGPFDCSQMRRRYNHDAVVSTARAGRGARIRLDAAGNACDPFATAAPAVVASDPSTGATTPTPEPSMPIPAQIIIGSLKFDAADFATAPALQQEVDRVIADLRSRLDAATTARTAAEKLATDTAKKLDGYKGRVVTFAKGLRAKLDAMKAKMIGCDECGGSGKVMDGAGAEGKCDYCDGAGSIRMHEAVKSMAPAAEGAHPEDDMEEMGEELDSGVPERESAAEEALETAANPDHPKLDAATRKQRLDARKTGRATARTRRLDSMERRASRRAVERATLIATAAKHLDGDAMKGLDGKPDMDIKRAVVAKLAPHLDGVDKMDAAQVVIHFGAECKRADAAGGSQPAPLSEGDRLRALIGGGAPAGVRAPVARVDADTIHVAAIEAKANAWQRPAKA